MPPKHFDLARFGNYVPEPDYPSQSDALRRVKSFVEKLAGTSKPSSGILGKFFTKTKQSGNGLYLDGGFGVGKTHLLASAYHAFNGPKAYLSFQELMFLVGLQTLQGVVGAFKGYTLLVLDELELDDPANTRITTNLLGQLFDNGVSILTSSNTPPGALGEGKFSVEDFQRELGTLTNRFETVRIDGEDYRTVHHLGEGKASTWVESETELDLILDGVSILSCNRLSASFKEFLEVLGKVHPMRIRKALSDFEMVVLRGIAPIDHPHKALRFVYFVDKAYDNNIRLFASASVEPKDLFQRYYFVGGDTKKYLRTISRLGEMTRGEVG
ncbi:MAG: cell division protein ZapE [Bacteroidetes bacterium]|nr:cell division protein ZapE [Bacteroidota bacterium]